MGADLSATDERRVLDALRAGDEAAFASLLERHHGVLVRVALAYVRDRAIAEEVVQETWLAVLQGLDRFEGRSSLKTWIFRIATNIARSRAERERRTLPFSRLTQAGDDDAEPAVPAERFLPADHPRRPGHWANPPESWGDAPEERLLAREARGRIEATIAGLPPAQQRVITLRDIAGWSSDEVCELLGLSAENQRVLLHRARSRVRRVLAAYFADG